MIDILTLADYLTVKSTKDRRAINNISLQMALYLIQGWHIKEYGKPLFGDDFEIWDIAPVVRRCYREYIAWGTMPIVNIISRSMNYYEELERSKNKAEFDSLDASYKVSRQMLLSELKDEYKFNQINKILSDINKLYPWEIRSIVAEKGKAFDVAKKNELLYQKLTKDYFYKYSV